MLKTLEFNRYRSKRFLENQTTPTPLTVFGGTQPNASPCGNPFATSLPQQSVVFQLLCAGDATLLVLPSNISGVSHRASEILELSVLSTKRSWQLLQDHAWSPAVIPLEHVSRTLRSSLIDT